MKIPEITKVQNINEKIDHTCSCESWIKHWEKYSENIAKKCADTDCNSDAEVGAHVLKEGDLSKTPYIIPLCEGHFGLKEGQWFNVNEMLISANVNETCDSAEYKKFKETRSLS